MSTRVDPGLLHELKEYGAVNIEKCFNCGNCTAICPLTSNEYPFPRNMIRRVQMGMKGSILQSTDAWQCYYCGECSETCPKGAEPAETMMAVRRWLIAQYDRSGHGARLYTSSKAAWLAILRYSLIPLALLVVLHALTAFGLGDFARIETDHVELNAFAPVLWIWAFVLVDFAILGRRVFSNASCMFHHVMGPVEERHKISLSVYMQELKTLLVHAITQKRWLDCGESRSRWLKHLSLVSGYGLMLLLIVGLLWWFQTDEIYPLYHPQRWLGYYATIVLLYASGEALIGRMRKREQMHKFSHHTDWLFPAFLFVVTLTGILVHIFRYAGWAWPTYLMYVLHIMVVVAMLDTEVGIGKWAHMIYRPLAMYLRAVQERSAKEEIIEGELASASSG